MVAKHYGRHYNTSGIRNTAGFSKKVVSLLGIAEAADKIGFRTRGVQLTYAQLMQAATFASKAIKNETNSNIYYWLFVYSSTFSTRHCG
jgi:ABC-type bacteriocin/lantibiotic exporter with double-glycine peptidase domain